MHVRLTCSREHGMLTGEETGIAHRMDKNLRGQANQVGVRTIDMTETREYRVVRREAA